MMGIDIDDPEECQSNLKQEKAEFIEAKYKYA